MAGKKGSKKMLMLGLGVLVLGGVGYFVYTKRKAAQELAAADSTGGELDSGVPSTTNNQMKTAQAEDGGCIGGKLAKGGGKGKLIAIDGSRSKATKVFKKGMKVRVDGVWTTITGMWKDKNKKVGALKLANGVADGKKICWSA